MRACAYSPMSSVVARPTTPPNEMMDCTHVRPRLWVWVVAVSQPVPHTRVLVL